MNIDITRENIDILSDRTPIEGDCMMLHYEEKISKAGNPYIDGYLCNKSKIPFKMWDGPTLRKLVTNDYIGKILTIQGEVNIFNNNHSIILKDFKENKTADVVDFMIQKYTDDQLEYYRTFMIDTLKTHLSKKGYELIDTILLSKPDLMRAFCTEFSSRTHHDNCIGGLLAHTSKMLSIATSLYTIYKPFFDKMGDDMKDLYFIGLTLHDLGKTKEMHFGEYQYQSSVTHRYLGVEMISKYRDVIENLYSSKWFYDLLSVLIQHHHIYEEKAKTVAAFMVYVVDMTESQMTNIVEHVEQDTRKTSSGEIIWLDASTPLTL